MKSKGHNFYLLSSVSVYDKPTTVKTKKAILAKFNERPNNVYGDLARIIVMIPKLSKTFTHNTVFLRESQDILRTFPD